MTGGNTNRGHTSLGRISLLGFCPCRPIVAAATYDSTRGIIYAEGDGRRRARWCCELLVGGHFSHRRVGTWLLMMHARSGSMVGVSGMAERTQPVAYHSVQKRAGSACCDCLVWWVDRPSMTLPAAEGNNFSFR